MSSLRMKITGTATLMLSYQTTTKLNEARELGKDLLQVVDGTDLLKLQLEKDELYKTHSQSIQKVQHKADLKNMQLETKLKALMDRLEKTKAQLYSVVSVPNMDQTNHQTALCEVDKNIKGNFDSSNNTIRVLLYKKDQISKARKDMLLYCKAELRAVGVPVEELRLEPSESSRAGNKSGTALDLCFAQT